MQPTITNIETFARSAGEILRQGYGQHLQIDYKSEIDLVTDVDRKSEAYLLGVIQQKFPDHQIVTEETGLVAGDESQCWYLDPIDGTVNYAHGIPIFSVSIAYAEHGKVILGAVYDPMMDHLFCAKRGEGVWLNGKPLRVSQEEKLDRSLLVTGFPYDIRTRPDNNLNHYVNLSLKSQGVRRLGSAALDLAYVAAGYFEGFWELSIHTWDIAAGILMVEEAGGKVTDRWGGDTYMGSSPSIIATNERIHDQLLNELSNS